MSYSHPQDTYTHSNASQFDDRYQQGAYRDEDANSYPMRPYADSFDQSSLHSTSKLAPPQGQGAPGLAGSPLGTPYQYNNAQWEPPTGGPRAPLAGPGAAAAQTRQYPARTKATTAKWKKIGIPIVLVLVVAGIVGGIVFWKLNANKVTANTTPVSAGWNGAPASRLSAYPENVLSAASAAAGKGTGDQLAFLGTDLYGNPAFKANANTAKPSAGGAEPGGCAADSETPSMNQPRSHPRLFAPKSQWDCLANRIANDAYLTVWDFSIMQNATNYLGMPPTNYSIDGGFGGSGILDVSREVQLRIKTFAYAYMRTQDQKWVDRAWLELSTAAGATSTPFGQTPVADFPKAGQNQAPHWNQVHFLDVAEMTAAFAIGYDWLYNHWSDSQRTQLVGWIKDYGLTPGMDQYTTADGWWKMPGSNNGNWNCVCNSGMILGALAILGDDTSGIANQILTNAVPNMKIGCMTGAYEDGTWSETANYWYFGTAAQARAVSALTTAVGSDQGLSDANPNFAKTGLFHMFIGGMAGLFAYGDNGPNKYSANANGMFYWARLYQNPIYALYQRDRSDAADPLSMFWYDTTTKGGFWNGLALDQWFNNTQGNWASMRSSWTDFQGTYLGVKSSNGTGHQTHGDLDAGDFVFDALGTRWAGEYGNGNYLSYCYFGCQTPANGFDSGELYNSTRYMYYRKATQGQNTLVVNNQNQLTNCQPTNTFASTNPSQSEDPNYVPSASDVAYFATDMSSCYASTSGGTTGFPSGSLVRGIRFLNGRRQILVQDDIASTVTGDIEWRVQTNASVAISSDGLTATLQQKTITGANAGYDIKADLDKVETVKVTILSPAGAKFAAAIASSKNFLYQKDDVSMAQSNNTIVGNMGDAHATVLSIKLQGGSQQSVQVLWQPQWAVLSAADTKTPPQVALSDWSLTSHN
ncbi:unnamed protein product [Tilletia controversa]|uniref:Heparinase II/III-like C-terminal domain-containing protein n=2 Tax=Tilletia TaxID=13289 RepID=A0A8X7MR83_9BASI|nr:hypothetical protein CF328_g2537 [Tilletia controversa]KAE8261607.1 hypothetical protein A4X03_0g3114 [Tilletia caries]CAD6922980.1 unnamed protein product [Tilletia laevis]KAE8245999.1 hypothetical protein A4X06_0g5264 [Tilletia controversa]CAD6884356.1 unnamed protein product [Tilletia caries]